MDIGAFIFKEDYVIWQFPSLAVGASGILLQTPANKAVVHVGHHQRWPGAARKQV